MPPVKSASANRKTNTPVQITKKQARAIWINAQRLNRPAPFGFGPDAVCKVIEHLGYVQIDTINVVERCHHHILFNRIPTYRRTDLTRAQSDEKTIFEYWTHALSFLPVHDFQFYVPDMKAHRKNPAGWSAHVAPKDLKEILKRLRSEGPLAISDIKEDKLVNKNHPWASRKPSKHALEAAFYNGQVTISRRNGMRKTYDLTKRHFGWEHFPRSATPNQVNQYLLNRALTAQGVVSLDSICHLSPRTKPAIAALIDKQVRAKRLVPVMIFGAEATPHWANPETLAQTIVPSTLTHILSPFDPLIIQRKRTNLFFNYAHLFEAYLPAAKRKLGYFTLPVLCGDEIVAALDLKTDRQAGNVLIQNWHWTGKGNAADHEQEITSALDNFTKFQLSP